MRKNHLSAGWGILVKGKGRGGPHGSPGPPLGLIVPSIADPFAKTTRRSALKSRHIAKTPWAQPSLGQCTQKQKITAIFFFSQIS